MRCKCISEGLLPCGRVEFAGGIGADAINREIEQQAKVAIVDRFLFFNVVNVPQRSKLGHNQQQANGESASRDEKSVLFHDLNSLPREFTGLAPPRYSRPMAGLFPGSLEKLPASVLEADSDHDSAARLRAVVLEEGSMVADFFIKQVLAPQEQLKAAVPRHGPVVVRIQ